MAFTILAILLGIILLVVCLLPVLLLGAVACFPVVSKDWRELHWALRAAALTAAVVAIVAFRAHGPYTSDFSIFWGRLARAIEWTWAGALGCTAAAAVIGIGLRLVRHRKARNDPAGSDAHP